MDITAAELNQRTGTGEILNILDVRSELEYSTFNVGGVNISLPNLQANIDDVVWHKNEEIIVVCSRGMRSHTGQQILAQNGYQNVRNLKGGLIELQKLNNNQ